MTNQQEMDMSVKEAPDSWLEAEKESPTTHDGKPLNRNHVLIMPIGKRVSLFSTLVAGLLGGFVGGTVWYLMETRGLEQARWVAPAIGLLIPGLVRIAAGGADTSIRAAVSLVAYVITLFAVIFLLTRREMISLYGGIPGVSEFEQRVWNRRFSNGADLLTYALGAIATIQVSIFLKDSTPRQ